MKNIEGFELIYPEGCKEVNESLKIDELRRRLTDIMKSLEESGSDRFVSTDALLNNTETIVLDTSNLKLEGLLMHLTCEFFIDHEDADVQLRVAVCICNILKLYCPDNPFLSFGDFKNRIKIVLTFLIKCINEMAKLKTKTDKYFLNLYKIFSICCQTNLFHWLTVCDDGKQIFLEFSRTCFNIVRKFPDWSEDNKPLQLLCDSFVVIISSTDVVVPDQLISYLLNFLADRCATKEQKFLIVEIINRCMSKLEDQIQAILQSHLIKSEIDDDLSDSSDNDECEEGDDEFCSMPEYKLSKFKCEQKMEKSKQKAAKKLERKKNTIETCIEYSCDHTFQLIYELFKISSNIVTPLLPTVEMKLRSPNNVTDRKRACRLLGKLFATYTPSNNNNHSSLWECFLGRFCDIEVEVREICVRVARDVLKRALSSDDISGILSMPSSKEDLVKALQKRSHDQEETIRYQLVVSISHIFDNSKSIIVDEVLDFVNDMLFKILLDRTRDKCLVVRKEANASLGKLFRRILNEADVRGVANGNVGIILGLGNLLPGQKSRLEVLLTQILRLYVRVEVEDKIVVERLFNTYIIPYHMDSSARMKSLVQCFTLCDESSLMAIQELFKTQVLIMNMLRETVTLIRDSSNEKVLSPSVSQKLKEKVKRLSEYLPNKDKNENLTKFFMLIRSDKKLVEIISRLMNPDSQRDVIVKSITEIKRHLSAFQNKPASESNPTTYQKKKALVSTVKCLLERGAPIIMDNESGQELLSLLVSSNEALESSQITQDYTISICRALKLMHVVSIVYRNSIPTQEAYHYIASIISQFDVSDVIKQLETDQTESLDDKLSTPNSGISNMSVSSKFTVNNNIPTTVEELCLLTLAQIIDFRSANDISWDNNEEDKYATQHDNNKCIGLFNIDGESQAIPLTIKVVQYLLNCAMHGSVHFLEIKTPRSPGKHKTKDRRGVTNQSEDGDREPCTWKYNARIAKLASRCLIGLYYCCLRESRAESCSQTLEILSNLELKLDNLVKNCSEEDLYSSSHPIMLSTLSQLGLHLRRRYGANIRSYVQQTVLMRILADEGESTLSKGPSTESIEPQTETRNLSLWTSNVVINVSIQVRIQALKMLSKWMVTLKVDDDKKLILSVMMCLKKYIGSFSNVQYSGTMTDGDMAQLRLAAGKCWLRLAQVQSFLSIFDVTWLHRLSGLIYDPCPQVRDGFLRKLHKGLFRLQLPLDYMAMFAFVPLVASPSYLLTAKNYFSANVTRRREFLERNPQYLSDAKLLFAVLPEYVLAFIIHMLAHDTHWIDVDDQPSIYRAKQCLWFVMEPILKLNENSSFIRKLLEKIKHAQDASCPNDAQINEKLYICCDIALGLLISKQATYDLKEYPVELKLPRTRYVPAPNSFFNPDFANILLENPTRARIQFSPTHKSKQMIMNFMPAPLIKGHSSHLFDGKGDIDAANDNFPQTTTPIKTVFPSKPKKHVAKIVVGLPEIESEGTSCQPGSSSVQITAGITTKSPLSPSKKQYNVRRMPTKRKNVRNESPISEMEEFESNPTSVTKRGRVCKPNVRVMKDMVSLSPSKKIVASLANTSDIDGKSAIKAKMDEQQMSISCVRLEGTVSVSVERIDGIAGIAGIMMSTDGDSSGDEDPLDTSDHQPVSEKRTIKRKLSQLNKKEHKRKQSKVVQKNKSASKLPNRHKATVLLTTLSSPRRSDSKSRQSKTKLSVNQLISPNKSHLQQNKSVHQKTAKIQSIISSPVKQILKVTNPNKMLKNKKSSPISAKKITRSSQETINTPTRRSQDTIKSSTKTPTTSSSDSTILKNLTKQVISRKAGSIMMMKSKKEKNNNCNPILAIQKSPKKTNIDVSKLINGSPKTGINPGKNKKSIDSPMEIISRSKRAASKNATDLLVKKKM